jgi:hypothetical protein
LGIVPVCVVRRALVELSIRDEAAFEHLSANTVDGFAAQFVHTVANMGKLIDAYIRERCDVGTLRARRKTVPLSLAQWQQEEAQGQPQPKRRRGQRGQAAPTRTTPVVQQFFVGQLVRAQWRTEDGVDPTWYEGTVQAFDAEGQVYHVTYEDGEQHEHVLPQHIRATL